MREKYKNKPNKVLKFLYNNCIGRILLYPLVNSKTISNLMGKFMDCGLSKILINSFIKKYNINISDYEKTTYNNFNEFFIRNIKSDKRKVSKTGLISPCDAKLTYYKINDKLEFEVKNSKYTISSLIDNKKLANKYKNGYVLVFRLSPEDYHHYYFIDSGSFIDSYKIKGKYHTVNPIVYDKLKVFKENERAISILNTKNYDDVIYIEVGALLVGKIVNLKDTGTFKKGEEKGYFKYGGSTVILIFKENTIDIDKDIINNSKNCYETIVKYGEKIGEKIK